MSRPTALLTPRLSDIMEKLGSPFVDIRSTAYAGITQLQQDDVDALIAYVTTLNERYHKRRRLYRILAISVGVIAIPSIIALIVLSIRYGLQGKSGKIIAGTMVGLIGGIGGGLGGGVLGGCSGLLVMPKGLDDAIRLIAELKDVRCVGPLCLALFQRPANQQKVSDDYKYSLARGLTNVLPLMAPADRYLLTSEHREAIYKYLKRCKPESESSLIVGLIHALKITGDATSVDHLQAFAERNRSRSKINGVSDEAYGAISAIRERIDKENKGNTLLRAATNISDDTLLRPAGYAVTEDPALLVRASDRPG